MGLKPLKQIGKMSGLQPLPIAKARAEIPQGPITIPRSETVVGDWYDPPPGFLTGQNSVTEWTAYKALAKIFGDPKDPRVGPFYGGIEWSYQIAELGGHVRALGSAVVDFVVYQGATIVGIRIQTEYFHLFTTSNKQAYDTIQRAQLEANGLNVVDVYDYDLLNDPSGQRAVIAMKRAIGRIERVNPIDAGSAIRGSRQKVIG